jgi:hypothetical protein
MGLNCDRNPYLTETKTIVGSEIDKWYSGSIPMVINTVVDMKEQQAKSTWVR